MSTLKVLEGFVESTGKFADIYVVLGRIGTTAGRDTLGGTALATETKPYIFFYGRCAEALEFYSSVFEGSAEITRVKDTPADVQAHMPSNSGEWIIHANFNADGVTFFASDGRQSKDIDADMGNISIGLHFADSERGERTIAALAVGGTVQMPIGPAFWGGRFANVVDKFGTEWMMTLP